MIKSSLEPLHIDMDRTEEGITSFGGMPAPIDAWAGLGLAQAAHEHLQLKERRRGLSDAQWAEVLTMLLVAGGTCLEDLKWMKMDSGLVRMWPILGEASVRSALNFLYRFHDPKQPRSKKGKARIPKETRGLQALRQLNCQLIRDVARRKPETVATIDVDASIHPATKRSALRTYDGPRGYQPVVAYWVEQKLVVGDQFRDGNVPAAMGNKPFLQRLVQELPQNVKKIHVRGDTALYEQKLLRWLDREDIDFAISADITQELRAQILGLPESEWKPYARIDSEGERFETDRECAEVAFTPEEPGAKKGEKGFRYIGIRIPKSEPDLIEGFHNHYAVVTNRWDQEAVELLNWQRKRCGTVEHVHDLLKNDMGARHFPSDRFGANAAWYRLNIIALNLLRSVMRIGLPAEWHNLRPATARFRLLRVASRIVSHSRQLTEIFCRASGNIKEHVHHCRVPFDQ